MSGGKVTAWRCMVCGYIHEGDAPPERCPLCGVGPEEFEPVRPSPAAPEPAPALAAEAPFQPPPSGKPAPRIVIVGGGVAGVAALEALREAAPDANLTLVARERGLPYHRLNLTRLLAGEIDAQELPLHPASWYDEQEIGLMAGTEVAALELDGRRVRLADGRRLWFDKLILATGAQPFLPPLPGMDQAGVRPLRTLEDAEAIREGCPAGARCIVIGGGILGLEAAAALARCGARATVLADSEWLLPRQLNRRGGEILAAHAQGLGIEIRPLARTRAITGDGRASGVMLETGERLEADFVIVAAGVRPDADLARRAGLRVNRGILVDDRLATSHPDVLAAGDVAEHRGALYGLWEPARRQGRIAGLVAAGVDIEFAEIPPAAALKVLGTGMLSIGRIEPQGAGDEAVLEQEADDGYCRLTLQGGRLVGAILVGQTRAARALRRAIEEQADLSGLLLRRPTARQLIDALD